MMKKDITVYVNSKTSMVDLHSSRLGISGENLQGNLIVKFDDEFVNGTAILEIQRNAEKYYLVMQKENESYYLPILSSLLSETTTIIMQIRITEGTDDELIPVWKSNKFYLKVDESINAETTIPEEYPEWIDIANTKLNQIDNLDIDATKVGSTATVSITNKEGITKSVEIYDGQTGAVGPQGERGPQGIQGERGLQGPQGERGIQGLKGDNGANGLDAKINGVNTLTIEAGTNVTLEQEGNILTINSTGGGGDYHDDTKQDVIDNTLTTINKTIPTAINEVNSIAKGANQALSYGNYSTMITAFNSLANNVYNVGQNVMIITLQVPDLWISGIESTSSTYTYTTDEAITTALSTNGYIQVGYYKLSALETQKVDLTDYVKNTDYATAEKGGTIRISNDNGLGISNGNLYPLSKAYNTYNSAPSNMFIAKGTLENVVAGKGLDLKRLSTFDRRKTQVLKNINGTLTWVDES